jgi:hypothetical protein
MIAAFTQRLFGTQEVRVLDRGGHLPSGVRLARGIRLIYVAQADVMVALGVAKPTSTENISRVAAQLDLATDIHVKRAAQRLRDLGIEPEIVAQDHEGGPRVVFLHIRIAFEMATLRSETFRDWLFELAMEHGGQQVARHIRQALGPRDPHAVVNEGPAPMVPPVQTRETPAIPVDLAGVMTMLRALTEYLERIQAAVAPYGGKLDELLLRNMRGEEVLQLLQKILRLEHRIDERTQRIDWRGGS